MSPTLCASRHPITQARCVLPDAHEGGHLASLEAGQVTWAGVPRRKKRDIRERVRGRDARQWGWTEAQR